MLVAVMRVITVTMCTFNHVSESVSAAWMMGEPSALSAVLSAAEGAALQETVNWDDTNTFYTRKGTLSSH